LGEGLQERERDVVADHSRRLEQGLVLRRQAIDPGREDGLYGGGHLNRVERFRQPVGTPLSGQRPRLHDRLHALLEEERGSLRPLGEQLLDRIELLVLTDERPEELLGALWRQRVEPELAVV